MAYDIKHQTLTFTVIVVEVRSKTAVALVSWGRFRIFEVKPQKYLKNEKYLVQPRGTEPSAYQYKLEYVYEREGDVQ